ncbi:hypothetical protein EJ07DRAFT_141515 [Lizonia empirigonia]|nr:hypothetical protein EJ07DRAFT_141515 [Lizonia empirigonia]
MPPKSILKKTSTSVERSAPTPTARSAKPVNQRHLDVALHHANMLEQRKAVEAQVLDSILTLIEFPSAPDADARRPAPADARAFEETVATFQPADYDALIEERNIADKCGYALCPKPKARARSTAKKQFVDTDRGVEIVDRKLLEVWCSDDCAKRALYVKVQLNEEPAWLRAGGHGDRIELMVDNARELHTALPVRPKPAALAPVTAEDEEDLDAAWAAHDDAAAELALERGEKRGTLSKANDSLVQDTITEHASSHAPPQPPSLPAGSTMAIEGHVPRHNRPKDEDDEEDAQDWDKHLPG